MAPFLLKMKLREVKELADGTQPSLSKPLLLTTPTGAVPLPVSTLILHFKTPFPFLHVLSAGGPQPYHPSVFMICVELSRLSLSFLSRS